MRILLVHPGPLPDFSVADVYRGWEKALKKQGHQVMTYNTNDRLVFYGNCSMPDPDKEPCETCGLPPQKPVLSPEGIMQMSVKGLLETCYTFWPQIIMFVSGFYFTPSLLQVLRERKHKIVMLHTESPYQDAEQLQRGVFADLNLLNDPANIEAWENTGIPVEYMPHAYDPDVHFPVDAPDYDTDFAFIGTAFPSRQKFFHEMDKTGVLNEIDVTFGGSGWDLLQAEHGDLARFLAHDPRHCVKNDETARIYRLSKTGINFYRREAEEGNSLGWAMGPREVEMAASGLFFLRDPRPEGDELFNGVLPTFNSPEEAADLLRYWVHHDAEREARAEQARHLVADRTFDENAKRLHTYLEEYGII